MADDRSSKAADLVRKALTAGVGAVFLTEESLRGLVSELKLPKELISGLLETAGKTKNDFFGKLSSDLIERLATRIDPPALISEILQRNEIELTIKVNVKPKKKAAAAAAAPVQSAPDQEDERSEEDI